MRKQKTTKFERKGLKMLNKIRFNLRFNRKIAVDRDYKKTVCTTDYISPGGYEITNKKNNFGFDFEDSYWNRDDQKPDTIHYHAKNLAVDEYPESSKITPETIINGKFTEFFIYTDDDANLIPLEINNVVFEFDDTEVQLSPAQIKEINKLFQT